MGMEWIKLDTYGILRGSIIAQLTLEERATWVSLLCFAGEQRDRGIIRRAKGIPYTREEIATAIHVPLEVLNNTITKCVMDENADDPNTRIMVGDDQSLVIGNWKRYQSKPEKQQAKEVSIKKAKETKKRQETAINRLMEVANMQNAILRKQRYQSTGDGQMLDTVTGQLISLEELEELQKGGSK